jgi:UDP-N-acetylglucosamine 3-dehydrogenase
MYRVGIIGCGRPWKSEGATGFGMARRHAMGYNASPHARLTALADIDEANARAFQADLGGERIYTDYREMLAQEELEIVSISTWPKFHTEMVIAAAEAGVKAIHCEKPMAPTYGEAKRMVDACNTRGVQLTFNHQRRFNLPFRQAKELLREGSIGALQRIEASCDNLFDWGTHWFDMAFFYNEETPAEWVIGQIDGRESKRIFDVLLEGQGLSWFRFQNGVDGLLTTGFGTQGLLFRLTGSEGVIEIGHSAEAPLRVRGAGDRGWRTVESTEGLHDFVSVERGVLDLVDALQAGREPELSARRALQATELIFATYESSRRRGRVDLPLAVEDSPWLTMAEEGMLAVTPAQV